jgi:hypothetical protein
MACICSLGSPHLSILPQDKARSPPKRAAKNIFSREQDDLLRLLFGPEHFESDVGQCIVELEHEIADRGNETQEFEFHLSELPDMKARLISGGILVAG